MRQKSLLKDSLLLLFWVALFYGIVLGIFPFMTPDEGRYVEIPREMLATGQYLIPHLNGLPYFEKPPLFYWMQTLPLSWLGPSPWSMRAWGALMSIFAAWATYAITRTIWNRRTGLIAATIQVTSFLYFALSHVITLDVPLTFFLTLCLYSLLMGIWRLDQTGKGYRLWFYLAYGLAALAVMTKGLIGVIFPIMIVGLWIAWTSRWSLLLKLQVIPGLILMLLICLPWHYAVQQRYPEFFDFYFIQQHIARYATPIAHRAMNQLSYIGIIVLGLFPWTILGFDALKTMWETRSKGPGEYNFFVVIWAISIVLFFEFSHSILVPYLLPIVAPLSIILAVYIDAHWHQKIAIYLRVIFFTLCLVLGAGFAVAPYFREMGDNLGVWLHFIWIGGLLIAMGWVGVWAGAQSMLLFFKSLVLGAIAVYISMIFAMPYVNTRSIKPLADVLKPLLANHPNAQIVSFDEYFQDLPFYLGRTVTVAGWKNELSFGLSLQPEARAWMVEIPEFWSLWKTAARGSVFAVGPLWLYEEAKQKNVEVCVIAWTMKNILVVNQGCGS